MGKIESAISAIITLKRPEEYIMGHFGIGNKERIELRNGLIFYSPNKNTTNTILSTNKEYKTKHMNKHKKTIILDIGACIGAFSIQTVKSHRNVQVYAYEPNTKSYAYLQRNIIENNQQKKITAYNIAVSDKKGKANFDEKETLGSGLTLREGKKVFTTTLKDIIKENKINKIDLLKMDCEGEEYNIIMHSDINTLKRIKEIQLEYHDFTQKKLISFINRLTRAGFIIEPTLPEIPAQVKRTGKGMLYAKRP